LSPWIIFKGKIQKIEWIIKLRELRAEASEEEPGYIYVSENGWTDSELGLKWL
jgi:hypothetical protein